MRRIYFLLLLIGIAQSSFAQYVYTIKADSVKITNSCDTAELILENHTQTVPGFLFNKGRGRTEFRRGLFSLNDSIYVLGNDTLNLNRGLNSLNANNGILKTGNTIQFGNDMNNPYGGPAYQMRPTFYNQNSSTFNWITGSNIFTVSKGLFSTNETNVRKDVHIARFAAPFQQGGLLLESYHECGPQGDPGPLTWLMVKNTNPLGVNTGNFFSDSYAAIMEFWLRGGTDGKSYTNLRFKIPGDTAIPGNPAILRLYPPFTSSTQFGGPIRLPTAIVHRLDITDGANGADNLNPLSYKNPYSRLVVDAYNKPIVVGSLPTSATSGRILVIDNEGKVWRGDSTSSLSGGGGGSCCPGKVKITSDVTRTSSTLGSSELGFAVNAGTYYKFRFVIVFATDATTTGIRLGLTAPSASVFSATTDIATGSDGPNAREQGSITSSGDWVMTGAVEAANTNYIAIVEGIILPSVSGSVQLVFGAGTNGNQVSLKAGSMGIIETY
jgi:hypothetical protein